MKCLIDADTIAFSCAATAEDSDLWVATARANEMLEGIMVATEATEYELWLSGPKNFRYTVYPEYKANRLRAYRPKWEKDVKDYLVGKWNANWSDGCEADDMVGARQTESTIIAHIDKDIDQIPGWHYHWGITRKGVVITPPHKYFISEYDADYNFYYQLIVGDKGTDNIPGLVGKGPAFAKRFLSQVPKEEWLIEITKLYSCPEELEMNAHCLYIWRKMNDNIVDRWEKEMHYLPASKRHWYTDTPK